MTFRNASSAENGSASTTTIQITLSADIEVGDVVVFAVKWTGTGHTTFTPSSSNGGTFTALTGVIDTLDAAARAQAWQRDAVAGDASSTITVNTDGSGRVVCVWVAHHGVDGSDPVIGVAFAALAGDTNFPAATPRVAWGTDGGDVVYVGLGRTPSGGQTVHSAGASGATLRVTATNSAGSGNNANGAIFDAAFAGSGEVAAVTTAADPDTAGRNTITLLYHAAAGSGDVTGTIAVTEAADTLAASGTHTPPPISGTLAVTEADDTLAASGTHTPPEVTGTVSVTEAADTLAASGTHTPPPITGTLAVTEQSDTLAASGTFTPEGISGSLAVTEAADTLSASGAVVNEGIAGHLVATEASDTLTAVGNFLLATRPGVSGPVAPLTPNIVVKASAVPTASAAVPLVATSGGVT